MGRACNIDVDYSCIFFEVYKKLHVGDDGEVDCTVHFFQVGGDDIAIGVRSTRTGGLEWRRPFREWLKQEGDK